MPKRIPSELLRLAKIQLEYLRGMRVLTGVENAVAVFGSARFAQNHPFAELAFELGTALGRAGCTVITGGGPGLMEAASRGARACGGKTIGLNILLPHEQRPNRYLGRWETFEFFFLRKQMFLRRARAAFFLPGGLGTLDELAETLALVQTRKMDPIPLVLLGSDYWKGLVDWMNGTLTESGAIGPGDPARLFNVVDSVSEALKCLGTKKL